MIRRSFLALSATALLSTTALTGCGTFDVSTITSDANIIAGGLAAVDVQMGNLGVVDPATMTKIGTALASIQDVAKALATASDKSTAQSLVGKLETYVNTFVNVAAGLPFLPPSITLALQAASILLPVIEVAVGLVLPSAAQYSSLPKSTGMTPDQARLVLRGAAMAPAPKK